MGYSIGIRARSKPLQKKMLKFMEQHYRTWPAVAGNPKGPAYVRKPSDDLSYDHAKSAIGIDYGPVSGWERVYAFAIVRWMALKVGRTRSTFTEGVTPRKTKKPVPYMVYDGYEAWPVIVKNSVEEVRKLPRAERWCCYTKLGMHTDPVQYMGELSIDLADNFRDMMLEIEDKIGARPPGDQGAWMEKRERLMLPHCQKKLDEQIKPLLNEMQRLDDLWNAIPR